ncbi:MAG: hypothetical protein ABIQ79_08980 [Nitrospiraceae bacterium]
MTDLHCDGGPILESLERVEVTSETNLNDILNSEQSEMIDGLPEAIDAFLLDRFSTELEDPRTGRKIIYPDRSM